MRVYVVKESNLFEKYYCSGEAYDGKSMIAKLFCAPYEHWAVCPSRDYRASVLCRSYSLTSKAWPEVINESGDLCAHSARKYL